MPQHDPNDEDFWTRSRRTRQSDKRSKRGRKRKDGEPGGNEIDWTDPDLPSAAPPTGRSRRDQGPSQQPPTQQRPIPPRVAAAQERPPAQTAPQGRDARSARGPEPRRQPQAEAPAARGQFLDEPPAGRGGSGASASPAAFGPPPTTQVPQATRPSRAGRTVPQGPSAPDRSSQLQQPSAGSSRSAQLQQPSVPGSGRSDLQPPPQVPGPGGRASAASAPQDSGGAGDPGAPGSSGRRSAASSARAGSSAAPRPDSSRSPGSPRRRGDRDAAEWTDPSSTNGPHLASRGSRSPALGSPEPWQGSIPAAVTGPTSGGTPLVPGMPPASAREAAQAATQVVPLVPGVPRAGSREVAQANPGRPSARDLQQPTPLVPGLPRAGSATAAGAAPPAPLPSRRDRDRDHDRDRTLGRADDLDGGPPTQAIGRVTGENPSLVDRIEGLASRATPPHGGVRASSGRSQLDSHEPLVADPLVDPRSAPPPPASAPTRSPGGPGYEQPLEEPYDDRYGGDLYEDTYADETYADEPFDDYDDEPDEPSRRLGCSRSLMAIAAVAVVLVIILLAVGLWVKGKIDPGGEPGEEVRVEVVAGQSTSEIGATLEDAGIISSSSVWSWYVRFKGGGDIQAGVYEIPTNLSMGEALDELGRKPLPPGTNRVTVPEGQTIAQIKQRLTASDDKVDGFTPEGFDAALADPSVRSKYLPADQASLEGTFFPETYDLAEDADEVALLAKMRDQFDGTMDELDATAGAAALQRTPYEIMIIASIVEEEARVDEDRPKVARVVYNRLANDEALFIDAINCYDKGEVPCALTDADFAKESAYNSRKTKGLPPTPIAAPGKASIDAALHPADGDWTFYVLDPNLPEGHHLFTSSLEDFNAAKARCRDAGLGCG